LEGIEPTCLPLERRAWQRRCRRSDASTNAVCSFMLGDSSKVVSSYFSHRSRWERLEH